MMKYLTGFIESLGKLVCAQSTDGIVIPIAPNSLKNDLATSEAHMLGWTFGLALKRPASRLAVPGSSSASGRSADPGGSGDSTDI